MEFQLADLSGETVFKNPGSINGEPFTLSNLEGCSVYLLDYTSEVEVTNCSNCRIFIGARGREGGRVGLPGCMQALASQGCRRWAQGRRGVLG